MRKFADIDALLALASVDIARELCPQGWDEVPASEEPGTYEAMAAHYARTGKIAVSQKSAFRSGAKRLWGSAEPWQAFFVWHDRCHIEVPNSFDPAGEAKVHELQVAQFRAWANKLPVRVSPLAMRRSEAVLAAHNLGRLDHWKWHGDAPRDLREFTMGYLSPLGLSEPVAPFIQA
jgi:hypothetical protein